VSSSIQLPSKRFEQSFQEEEPKRSKHNILLCLCCFVATLSKVSQGGTTIEAATMPPGLRTTLLPPLSPRVALSSHMTTLTSSSSSTASPSLIRPPKNNSHKAPYHHPHNASRGDRENHNNNNNNNNNNSANNNNGQQQSSSFYQYSSNSSGSSNHQHQPEDSSLLEQDPTPEHLQIQADITDLADSNDYEYSTSTTPSSSANNNNNNNNRRDGNVRSNSSSSIESTFDRTGIMMDPAAILAAQQQQQQQDPNSTLLRMKSCPHLSSNTSTNNHSSSNTNSSSSSSNKGNGALSSSSSSSSSSSPFGNVFWKGRKVSSTDIASVGNASDTDVRLDHAAHPDGGDNPTTTGGATTTSFSASGRALHENAKLALNRKDYATALVLFEAILTAQVNRFGPCHASVAAAMHNVGGTLFFIRYNEMIINTCRALSVLGCLFFSPVLGFCDACVYAFSQVMMRWCTLWLKLYVSCFCFFFYFLIHLYLPLFCRYSPCYSSYHVFHQQYVDNA
jgi:hypothetical protein